MEGLELWGLHFSGTTDTGESGGEVVTVRLHLGGWGGQQTLVPQWPLYLPESGKSWKQDWGSLLPSF